MISILERHKSIFSGIFFSKHLTRDLINVNPESTRCHPLMYLAWRQPVKIKVWFSSCSPLFVNLPHIFEWVLFHNPLQGAVIPIACTLFSTTSFPSLRPSINVLGHRALWTASLFCNDLLCLALLVQGVNGRLLDNCQVSSLPHDCVAYRTRLRDHLKAFAGVLS